METILTPAQKTEYTLIRDNFQIKRNEIGKFIQTHQLELQKSKLAISNLEKEVERLRPRIENCDNHMVCKRCDTYSMKFLGSSPQPDKYFFYECVICGYEEQNT
jgi:hypothetical protein